MAEMYHGAFDLLKIRGYLYTVEGDGFHEDPRLMGPQELVNPKRVRIIKTERIKSLYDALVADRTVRLVPDAERAKFFEEYEVPAHE